MMHAKQNKADTMDQDRNNSQQGEQSERDRERADHPADHNEPQPRSASEVIEMSEEAAQLVKTLEGERDEALAARQRALADFQNYQRRAAESERKAAHYGAVRVVRSIIPVLDHFDLALQEGEKAATAEQIIGGVRMVREELHKALQAHGVQRIEPKPGDEFDPNRHEAMSHQPAEGIEPNHIVDVYQPGYAIGEQVLRPAKVIVASPDESAAG